MKKMYIRHGRKCIILKYSNILYGYFIYNTHDDSYWNFGKSYFYLLITNVTIDTKQQKQNEKYASTRVPITRVFYTRDDNWITWLDVALIYIFPLIYTIIIHYTIIQIRCARAAYRFYIVPIIAVMVYNILYYTVILLLPRPPYP